MSSKELDELLGGTKVHLYNGNKDLDPLPACPVKCGVSMDKSQMPAVLICIQYFSGRQ